MVKTKICCVPSCPSRKPKRSNVIFFLTYTEAKKAGFRACKRCLPQRQLSTQPKIKAIEQVCREIESRVEVGITLAYLARKFELSSTYIQRLFKGVTGISPQQYLAALRLTKFKQCLKQTENIAKAIYEAGYSSSSSLYENISLKLGMTPKIYQQGGIGTEIIYSTVECDLGYLLVAVTEKGICAVKLGDRPTDLIENLEVEFNRAIVVEGNSKNRDWSEQILKSIKGKADLDLPLDIRGTVFQQQVWQALQNIPYGQTRTYREIAGDINKFSSSLYLSSASQTQMKISHLLESLLLAAVWGVSFLFTRIAAPDLGPILLIESRVLLAGITLLLISTRLNLVAEICHNWLYLLILGCINSAIPFVLFAFAALYLPAGFSSILNAAAPLFGTSIAGLWLKEKLTLGQFIGLIIGFAGVTILVGWTKIPVTSEFVWAVAGGLIGAFLYAVAAPYARHKLAGVNAIAVATGSQLGAALVLLPVAPWFVPDTFPSMTVIAVVVALGLFSTALAYVIYFHLIDSIGASKTLTVTYLIPLFAMFWGALILGEPITPSMILGCALILSGTAIAVYQ